jgi:WD40 repeat protein/predicted Ser/Thr protein kinase
MEDKSSYREAVEKLAEEFVERYRCGERPDISEYCARLPDQAAEIRDLFRTILMMEGIEPEEELREFFKDHERMLPRAGPLFEATLALTGSAGAPDKIRYFGDYELLEEIARGGMGVVFKARQVTLNRIVAVKMILGGHLAGPEDVQRFHIEAEAAAQLDHPGIVPIYEVGEQNGQHYFSMGFVEGESLAKRVAEGPLEPKIAAEIVRTVSEAVQYAHERGVIHRDLKPGNVLLDKHGKPKVTDFGLAKLTESGSDLTGTGQILGTPSYMPPEQAAAQVSAVDRLSDVYSLGAILYCLLTGRPPFQAANPLETLLQVQKQEPVAASQLNPHVPLDLDTIVLKCLEKPPMRRYGSAQALAEELQRYLEGRPILARPVGRAERFWRWCRREPVVATLGATVVVALIAGTLVSSYFAVKERTRADSEAKLAQANGALAKEKSTLADEKTQLAEDERAARLATERQLRITKAEKLAALSYAKRSESPEVGLLLAVESGQATRLSDEGLLPGSHQALLDALSQKTVGRQLVGHQYGITNVAISPDGHWIVTAGNDWSARIWDLTAKNPAANPRVLNGHQGVIGSVAISSDSRWLVTGSMDNTARVWDLSAENPSANPRILSGHTGGVLRVAISSDSHWIVTGSIDKTARIWDLTAEDPCANPSVLNGHRGVVFGIAISPDNRWIVTGNQDNTARVWDLSADDPAASPRVLSGHVDIDGHIMNTINTLVVSPDSRWIVTGGGIPWVWDLSADDLDANPRVLIGHPRQSTSVAISADSRWVVTGSEDKTARIWDLTAEDPSASPRVLIGHQHAIYSVAISPDNRWVVTGSVDTTARVWDLTAEDPALTSQVLSAHHLNVSSVAISPDSRWLVTGSMDNTARVWDLTAMNTAANPKVLSGNFEGNIQVAISSNSRWIVTRSNDNTARVWDLTAEDPSANPRVLNGYLQAFASDNRWLVTASLEKTARVWDLAAEDPSANPRVLIGQQGYFGSVISPDGRWLVTLNGSGSPNDNTLWDLAAANPADNPRVLSGPQSINRRVAISSDSHWIVTWNDDKTARVWDLSADDPAANPRVLSGHQDLVYQVAISPDSRWLVTGSMDNTARVWDLSAKDPSANSRILTGHNWLISAVAISHDSRWVATGSGDNTARVWDLTAEDPSANPRVLNGHYGAIYGLAFSSDGRWIVTGSNDKTARLWDLSADDPSANSRVLSGHRGVITSVAMSPDNRWIVTGSIDGTVRVWRWQWDDLVELAGTLGRNLTREEWKQYFSDEPYRKTFADLPAPGNP